MTPSNTCKVCGKEFSARGIHAHISKAHNLELVEYYMKYYPRKNLLTGAPLLFKDVESYFEDDFSNRDQMIRWCETADPNVVREHLIKRLESRVQKKGLVRGPSHLEMETSGMPPLYIYKKFFGSYRSACENVGVVPIFTKGLPKNFDKDFSRIPILRDTREQHPLDFPDQMDVKLDFGDYTTNGHFYSKTFVERKSESDFKGSMVGQNFQRVRNELWRAADMGCYIHFVTESSISAMEINNRYTPHQSNMKFVFHNMRLLQHEFADHCQFIFSGNRRASTLLVPKLLGLGQELWKTDLQYFIDNGEATWLG